MPIPAKTTIAPSQISVSRIAAASERGNSSSSTAISRFLLPCCARKDTRKGYALHGELQAGGEQSVTTRHAGTVATDPPPYQLVTEPSSRLRCGASQNLKLCCLIASSSTSTPSPGASETT